MKHLHDAFEPRLRSLIERHEPLRTFVRGRRERGPALERDLAALGGAIGPALPATRDAAVWAATRPLDDVAPLVGILYTREALSAGGPAAARALRVRLGADVATAWLDPTADEPGPRWRVFHGFEPFVTNSAWAKRSSHSWMAVASSASSRCPSSPMRQCSGHTTCGYRAEASNASR